MKTAGLSLLVLLAAAPGVNAAGLPADGQADLRRAVALVGLSSSEEPALRQEGTTRDPSPGFRLGAALGAWINAAAQLDFDLKNPAGAGPPHVSQAGGDADALAQDCADERTAFDHLQSRSQALGLTPGQVLAAAGATQSGAAPAWENRQSQGVAACR